MVTATRLITVGLILCLAAQTAQAKTHFVGDDVGWTFTNESSGLPVNYQEWADQITFMKDDVLVFNYTVGQQNLYIFDTYEGWMACNFSRGYMIDNGSAGMSEWTLTAEGHYEFASAMFCHQKQKFSLYAVDPQLLITQVTSDVPPSPGPLEALAPLSSNVTTPTEAPLKSPGPPSNPTSPPPPSASAPVIVTQVLMIVVGCATFSVVHSF